MHTSTSERDTLGNKHKQYNESLRKTLANGEIVEIQNIDFDKHDQDNLLMIDIASEKRDVAYVLNILKSEDMLYTSRALQKCTWLFNDDQYAHIINPKYLHDQLLPEMTTKTGIKLIKCIRRHLNNEQRAEEFYLHEQNIKEAIKWLPNCSIVFIENNIENCVGELDIKIFKRLCEKSVTIFEIMAKTNISQTFIESVMFLLNTHADKFLDIVENRTEHFYPNFSAKATAIIMKTTPDRIINNFEKYVMNIDIPTFAHYMKKENIKDFLYEQVRKRLSKHKHYLISSNLLHFIKRIPHEERFDFVKNVFIDKIQHAEKDEAELLIMLKLSQAECLKNHYEWYSFAPFDTAFKEIKKLLQTETNQDSKYSMLKTLILCAGKNEKDLQTLLQYYANNHINDVNNLKNQFIRNLIKSSEVYKCSNNSWQILNEILLSMDVYIQKDHNVQDSVILIILHNILNGEDIPEIIYNKFSFDSLKVYSNKLTNEEKEKIFNFLYNYLFKKIENQCVTTEIEFEEMKKTMDSMLTLLVDWKKELFDFPFLLNKIKDMCVVKQKNSWNTNLSTLYNIKKSWRKHMFEDSILLNPSEKVCLNALKHDPGLLLRYKNEVEKLRTDDKVSLRILLSKLRIYWPETLAISWTNEYQENLKVMGSHKAVTRGICNLMPHKSLLNIIKTYAPKEAKINWKEIDEITLSLQKNIAKNMHLGRPQIDPNAILWYAKGDYLQYALPSLLAVYYNMNSILSREFIPKLLDAPVSVQKHGIRFAFLKLDATKLKTIFSNIWSNSKNPTIRAELFKHTFKLLTDTKENAKVEEIGGLLMLFIDNLTHKDDPKIFDLLVLLNEVPLNIRTNYLMKCYSVFKRLQPYFPTKDTYQYKGHMQTLAEYSREVMESIDEEFIVQIIQEYLDTEFFNSEGKCTNQIMHYDGMVKVISAYLLCTKDVETQTQRYEKILVPLIKRVLNIQTKASIESYANDNFGTILHRLNIDLAEYVIEKNLIIPYKMFSDLYEDLKSLQTPENYVTLTTWKLATAFAKLLNETDTACAWDDITINIAPEFSEVCTAFLKEEVTTRFSCVYIIFSRILRQLLSKMPTQAVCIICQGMLKDINFIQAFLTVISVLPSDTYLEETKKQKYEEIHKLVLEQPSAEVKMHYYNAFRGYLRL